MKMKFDIKSLALGGLLSAAIMFSIAATTEKITWHYKIIAGHLVPYGGDSQSLGQQLDQAAADGWEVVSAASEEGRPLVILRRAK
jgi:hypothetical protein